jgi:hypothetical protein
VKVRATQKGYYARKVREPGEEFGLTDEADFSARWMVRVDPPRAKAEADKSEVDAKAKATKASETHKK